MSEAALALNCDTEIPPLAASNGNLQLSIMLLSFVRAQLPQLSAYIESQAVSIVEEFKSLSIQTLEHSKQMQHVIEIASNIELKGEVIPYEKSVEILYEPLANAIEKILEVSKLSMSMVMNIGNAAENINRVEVCVEHVQALTKQTNMLAMNTQIEAARAGEAGRSFRIIAQEVKALSEHIQDMSKQIQSEVSFVARSVRKSSDLVDNLAHYDMTENLELRDKVDELIKSILHQNQHFSSLLQDAADNSEKTGANIGNLVIGIQFQDRSSQVMEDLCHLFDHALALLNEQAAGDKSVCDEAEIAKLADGLKLSDVRNHMLHSFASQGSLSRDSDVVKRHLNGHANDEAFESKIFVSPQAKIDGAEDEDDIELF